MQGRRPAPHTNVTMLLLPPTPAAPACARYAGDQMETPSGDKYVVLHESDILCKAA